MAKLAPCRKFAPRELRYALRYGSLSCSAEKTKLFFFQETHSKTAALALSGKLTGDVDIPMKSTMRRPSQSRPDGLRKKPLPFGARMGSNAAEIPPVSEFESPKLYIAGKTHPVEAPATTTHKPRTNPDAKTLEETIF